MGERQFRIERPRKGKAAGALNTVKAIEDSVALAELNNRAMPTRSNAAVETKPIEEELR